MKKVIVCLLDCSDAHSNRLQQHFTNTLSVDESKSENEISQLNYFGERLNSTIQLTNSIEIEAYWLNLKDDKIYFLTNGLDDTSSVGIDKINTIRFYDGYGGCMKGGWLGSRPYGIGDVAFIYIY